MRIILASKSWTRAEALKELGLEFETIASNFDEKSIRDKDPERLALKLSEEKSKAVNVKDALIISGDLFVVFNNRVYEKPKTKEEAFEMIKSFSNNSLEIVTAIAIRYNGKLRSAVETFKVQFRELSDSEIWEYIDEFPVIHCAAGFEGQGLVRFSIDHKDPTFHGISKKNILKLLNEFSVKYDKKNIK